MLESIVRRGLASCLLAVPLLACAPEAAESKGSGSSKGGSGSQPSSAGGGSNGGQGNATGSGGDNFTFRDASLASGGSGAVGDACAALTQEPEQIIVFQEASVVDTIVSYKPIAIYVMQDRSGSMIGEGGGDPTSWPNSVNALNAFANDPASEGLDVGLAMFPPVGASRDCDTTGATCGAPVVAIGALPNNATAIADGLTRAAPTTNGNAGTPTECAVKGMINHCLTFMQQSPTGERCVAVLVTDGEPNGCNEGADFLTGLVQSGNDSGVLTFTLGLPGSNLDFLNRLAVAGGTTAAVDVSSQAAFVAALNAIRQKVVTTESHTVSTPVTIKAPLACEWRIPPPEDGQKFDKGKVNVQLARDSGEIVKFGYVKTEADCAQAGGGWYYDVADAPERVIVCPESCEVIKNSTDSRIDLLFGCETEPAKFN